MTDCKLISEPELFSLFKGGNRAAFAEIYNRFYSLLYIHAFRRLNDNEVASDLTQDIFIELWEKRNDLVLRSSLSSYLYAMVRNRIIDRFSHRKVSDKYLSSLAAFFDKDQYETDFKIRENQLRILIEREIAALPESERRIFLMSRSDDMSYKEIAEKLNTTEEAVKSKMKRTLKLLRSRLGLYGYLVLLYNFF